MSVKRRQFTSQFKAKVAMEAMKGQRTIGELAGLYQVHPSRIAAWKKHLVEYSAMAFEESSVQGSDRSPPALMAQLYEQIGRLQVELSWLKKSLDWTPDQKRQAVDADHPRLSMRRQCERLGLSASSLYYHRVPVDPEDLIIMGLIDRQYLETPFYGVLRMTAWLRRQGLTVGVKRVRRLMRQMGLEAIYPKPRTSMATAENRHFPYLLKGLTVDHPDHVWCIDITYVGLHTGWAYWVAIMDWFSRYVLSWELSNTLDTGFCLSALERAMHRRRRPEIFNSDQGGQFTSEAFVGALEQAQIKISMDGRGRAYDNIFIERLWRAVKYENLYPREYETMAEASMGLRNYFEFYNQERLHQSLDYQAPAEVYQARPTVGCGRGAAGSKAAPPLALRALCGAALLRGKALS